MVVADAEAFGGILLDAAEALGDAGPAPAPRAGAAQGRDTNAFGGSMVDGDDDRDLAVLDDNGKGRPEALRSARLTSAGGELGQD